MILGVRRAGRHDQGHRRPLQVSRRRVPLGGAGDGGERGHLGFLAGCVSGAAEAIFDTADQLNGLDAWRRLVRHIDHGREINFEMLRREMKHIQNCTSKDIFGIEEGVANFDNVICRYTKAGGDPMRDS